MISGGLTIDATQAENHTTLLVIEPNHNGFNEPQGLWVGSDDGRLHFSPDDGKTWNDVTGNLPGFKEGAWIPYVEASVHNPAEAWVIVNDFRRGDTKPYVYHTTDYGKTFRQIISPLAPKGGIEGGAVVGHTLAIVQDPYLRRFPRPRRLPVELPQLPGHPFLRPGAVSGAGPPGRGHAHLLGIAAGR